MNMIKNDTVIVDYGAGNIRSVCNTLLRIGVNPILTSDKSTIKKAKRVIIPGVGHASTAVKALNDSDLFCFLQDLTQPVLGICLGMQLMCDYLHEGDVRGLSIFPIEVLPFDNSQQVVPHMGWNKVEALRGKFPRVNYAYFVHSYYVPECQFTIGRTLYGFPFSSAIKKDNFIGVQFHPEKSGTEGQNFLQWFVNEQFYL